MSTGVTEVESDRLSPVSCAWLLLALKEDVRKLTHKRICLKCSMNIPFPPALLMSQIPDNKCCDDQQEG